ncbi:MAG: nucleoside recognition protein [bacterium]|nr:nucleoside recognition protein [bacterium]
MLNAIWAFMILLAVFYAACTGHMNDVTDAALDSAGEAISLCLTMAGVVALWMGLMEIAKKAGLIEKLTRTISPFLTFLFPDIPRNHPAREYIAANIIANVLGLGWACTPAGLKAMEELAKLEKERGNPEYLKGDGPRRTASQSPDPCRQTKKGQIPSSHSSSGTKRPVGRLEECFAFFPRRDEVSYRGTKRPVGRFCCDEVSYRRTKGARSRSHKRLRGTQATGYSGGNRHASNEMCNFLILNISSLQLIPVNMIAYRAQYGSANPTAIIAPAIIATLISSVTAVLYCKMKDRTGKKEV